MATTPGTASSVTALLGTAITLVQQLQHARNSVKGKPEALDDVAKELDSVYSTLCLVQSRDGLQTANVGQQLRVILAVSERLKEFFSNVRAEQAKNDVKLSEILSALDRARVELVLRINLAMVGLMGNLQDGFYIVLETVQKTNADVKRITGQDLALAVRIKDKQLQEGGIIPLEQVEIEALGLSTQLPDLNSTRDSRATTVPDVQTDNTTFADNITLDQVRMFTGLLDVQDWENKFTPKTTIARNKFGRDIRIMTGVLGGQAAAGFNENFWK